MTARRTCSARIAVVAALFLAAVGAAQEKVGSVAALEGTAEALHPGVATWAALAAGDDVLLGDQLRTLADSKLKLLFRDDSVLTLAPNSQLKVDESVAGTAKPQSGFSLLAGSVRAIVTEKYGAPGARFEVETPTAVAGVRGTGFIASYDQTIDETLVVGLVDTTRVRSKIDPRGVREVLLAAGFATRVRRGSYPLRPSLMPEDQLRSLSGMTSVAGGGAKPETELAPSGKGAGAGNARVPGGGSNALSPENKAIDQPIQTLRQRKTTPQPPPAASATTSAATATRVTRPAGRPADLR